MTIGVSLMAVAISIVISSLIKYSFLAYKSRMSDKIYKEALNHVIVHDKEQIIHSISVGVLRKYDGMVRNEADRVYTKAIS